jgi:hypothetical protein
MVAPILTNNTLYSVRPLTHIMDWSTVPVHTVESSLLSFYVGGHIVLPKAMMHATVDKSRY